MVSHIRINPSALSKRWLCYVDLLGFKDLVQEKGWIPVFAAYSKALETLHAFKSYRDLASYVWFSDTFIMYTPDDSRESYISIEQKARHFVYFLITGNIPLRGSISCGEYYADQKNGIYFGKALIEAYEYGEAQDWIGLIQCPSTISKLTEYGLDVRLQMNFPFWRVPFKSNAMLRETELPAYRIGEHIKTNGRNACLDALRSMAARNQNESVARKYANTIDFIEKNRLFLKSELSNRQLESNGSGTSL